MKYLLALYVGIVAPDIVGRDQRTRSLTLYFTRAVTRTDYALGKLAAMTTAMLAITLLPQMLPFIGNALSVDDFGKYAAENWDKLSPIVGTALFGSWLITSISTLIAAQTPHRAFATVGIIVAFLLPIPFAAILVEEIDAGWTDYAVFLSPMELLDGLTYWMFRKAPPESDTIIAKSVIAMPWFGLAATIFALICTGLLVRRYHRVQA